MPYLYGSSIQGIQSFIFETNKLKEIIGASELVDELSSEQFIKEFDLNEEDFIQHAAGNIKLVLSDVEKLKQIVKSWTRIVEEKAPGLTISQGSCKKNT